MLHFEHVVPVDAKAISRADLWKALVFRAQYPGFFTPGLECTLQPGDDRNFVRVIRFADTQLHDRVTLSPQDHIHSLIDGRHQPMHAECLIAIEEPQT
jgi:antibiotic biosynthesis monooxygenase (ABM) superfamily enzyme